MPGRLRAVGATVVSAALVVTGLVLAAPASAAGPTVTASLTAQQLAEQIIGPGLGTVSNVVYTGAAAASGSFSGFDSALGITDGLVLSTGSAAAVLGPNADGAIGTDNGLPGDPVLGAQTADASILEFDFVPAASPLTFTYVFGSEEYPEFVHAEYNDKFSLAVNGGNCAVIPGTSTPVSIDTVNAGTNAAYYRSGIGSPFTQMDGYTTALTCTASVTVGQTNHLRLSIADDNDGYYDSWALIEAKSVRTDSPPTAPGIVTQVAAGSSVSIPLQATDPDGDPISYEIVHPPALGTVTLTGSIATYTSPPGFVGTATFDYRAVARGLSSNTATVFVNILSANRPPTAGPVTAVTETDLPVPIHLLGADPDGDPLSYIVTPPAHGAISGSGATLTYTPASGFSGVDSFSYMVLDGAASATSSITVTVLQNLAPTADPQSAEAPFGGSVPIALTGTDPESAPLSYAIASAPAHGTLDCTGATCTYTPASGFVGTDSFAFTVSDGRFVSAPASVDITVPAPALTVTPSAVTAGDVVEISGSGFAPLAEVALELRSTPVALGTVTAGLDGRFTTSLPLPADTAAGTHAIVALVQGAEAARAAVTVTAPTAVTPPAGGTSTGLAQTGAATPWSLLLGGAALLIGGLVVRRRRAA